MKKKIDMEPALQGFETITGVSKDAVYKMFSYALDNEQLDDWIKVILPYRNITDESNLFYKEVGTFDVKKTYENAVTIRRQDYIHTLLRLVRYDVLQKESKRLKLKGHDDNSIESIRYNLSLSPDLDLEQVLWKAGGKGRKIQDLCGKRPPFPLFVHADYRNNNGWECWRRKKVHEGKLLKCAISGCIYKGDQDVPFYQSTPFWLVPIPELQARGYFEKGLLGVVDQNQYEYDALENLYSILSLPDTNPARLYLLGQVKCFNSPDTIDSLDEIRYVGHFLEDNSSNDIWPMGGDSMPPPILLNALRNQSDNTAKYTYYDFLDKLKDCGSMRVLRTSFQIKTAVIEPNNYELNPCGRSLYKQRLEQKECVLVKLTNEKGKTIAMGEHSLGDQWSMEGWKNIYEIHKIRPSQKILDAFDGLSDHIHRWFNDSFIVDQQKISFI